MKAFRKRALKKERSKKKKKDVSIKLLEN